MKYLRFGGIMENAAWAEENDNRRVLREKARKIHITGNEYNRKLNSRNYFFVASFIEETVTIGIICRDALKLDRQLDGFLKAVNLPLKKINLEEITFEQMHHLLEYADSNDFIEDADTVLEQFEVNYLANRFSIGLRFGENVLEPIDRKTIYAEAERYLIRDTFLPELDRIYAGKQRRQIYGHPVHYMIQTDDACTRREMCRLLLQALHANDRLQNLRYTFLNFHTEDEIFLRAYDQLYQASVGGAIIVRYYAEADMSEGNQASGDRSNIEALCEMMKKYRNKVLTVFCLPRECARTKRLFYENLGSNSFVELKEELVSGARAEEYLVKLARENGVRPNKALKARLEENRNYLAPDLQDMFDTWYNDRLKTDVYPQYREVITLKKETAKAVPLGTAYDDLKEMVGLDEAKQVMDRALNYFKAQKLFADKGMKAERPVMSMVFTGNPGTAKTSVARLFARVMQENGLLSKGKLIECGRGDLVGRFVGWTAPTIQKKFQEAKGSVLFIDEAYSLVDDRDGSYGDEAINTIVQEMENHREDVVVIFAGYPDKMEQFLQKNPGLRSRIAFHVPFKDYNTEELCGIARLLARQKGLQLTEDAMDRLEEVFDRVRTEPDFGNGRYVRNVIEKARMAQATRLLSMDVDRVSREDIATLCGEDIELPFEGLKEMRRPIGFCS